MLLSSELLHGNLVICVNLGTTQTASGCLPDVFVRIPVVLLHHIHHLSSNVSCWSVRCINTTFPTYTTSKLTR